MSSSVLLDTGFLISLVNEPESTHATASRYFKHCIERRITLYLSPLVVAEFELHRPIPPFIHENIVVLPFNFDHGRKAAALNFIKLRKADRAANRDAIKTDVMLIGQAVSEGISHILTRDNGMSALCDRLRKEGAADLFVINVREGFREGLLAKPAPAPLFHVGKPAAERAPKAQKPKAE